MAAAWSGFRSAGQGAAASVAIDDEKADRTIRANYSDYMRASGEGPSEEEVERRFAELTAGLEQTLLEQGSTEPVPQPTEPPSRPPPGPRDFTLAVDELDESFVPEPPPSLETVDRVSLLGWVGAVGGPIIFILLLLAWQEAPVIVWVTALAATLVGWSLVLWRLPRSRADDDDDGAVV